MDFNKKHNPALLLIQILKERAITNSYDELLDIAIVYDTGEMTHSSSESVCYGYIRCLIDNNLADGSLLDYFEEFVTKEFTEHGEYK